MDTPVSRYLEAILGRAEEVLEPTPVLSIIAPGAEVSWDNCCGQLWVRLTRYGPIAMRRGEKRKADGTMCVVRRVAEVEIGMLRCAAVVDDQGNPPTEEELTEDGKQVLADAEALWHMLECEIAISSTPQWMPLGPEGACVGGVWTFQVEFD